MRRYGHAVGRRIVARNLFHKLRTGKNNSRPQKRMLGPYEARNIATLTIPSITVLYPSMAALRICVNVAGASSAGELCSLLSPLQ
jgi:hypothetical protein